MVKYDNHKRETLVEVIEVLKYTIDGKPTCYSWFGGRDHESEICQFLLSQWGCKFECSLTGDKIWEDEETHIVTPSKKCPLWRSRK